MALVRCRLPRVHACVFAALLKDAAQHPFTFSSGPLYLHKQQIGKS